MLGTELSVWRTWLPSVGYKNDFLSYSIYKLVKKKAIWAWNVRFEKDVFLAWRTPQILRENAMLLNLKPERRELFRIPLTLWWIWSILEHKEANPLLKSHLHHQVVQRHLRTYPVLSWPTISIYQQKRELCDCIPHWQCWRQKSKILNSGNQIGQFFVLEKSNLKIDLKYVWTQCLGHCQ